MGRFLHTLYEAGDGPFVWERPRIGAGVWAGKNGSKNDIDICHKLYYNY